MILSKINRFIKTMFRALGKKANKTVHAETCKKAGPRKYKCVGLYGELLQKHQEYQENQENISQSFEP
jgi:hypothetical protein